MVSYNIGRLLRAVGPGISLDMKYFLAAALVAAAPLFAQVTADFVALRPSTGQILAAANFAMQSAGPGIYATKQQGAGQAAATKADGSVKGGGNAIKAGDTITLWLTGGGFMPNVTEGAPGAAISTPAPSNVFIGFEATTNIQYSGVSPQYPDLGQINAPVPTTVPPGPASVIVPMNDDPGNCGGANACGGGPGYDQELTPQSGLISTIAVK